MALPEKIRLTYADYRELPEDGKRYELLEGEIVMCPSASRRHQETVTRLMELLLPWIRERALGRLYTAPLDVILSDETVVQPDLIFIAGPRNPRIEGDYIHGAPDLVVEVLSPTSIVRDRGVKRQLYARHGVPEYWVIDPAGRALTVLALTGKEYREIEPIHGEPGPRSQVLAGLLLDPGQVFPESAS